MTVQVVNGQGAVCHEDTARQQLTAGIREEITVSVRHDGCAAERVLVRRVGTVLPVV